MMKVARLYAPGRLELEMDPDPEPGPGELVIRVRACALCGTDLKIFRHGHSHLVLPRVLGHEIAGEVVALGEGITNWVPGDRVQVIAAIPCGECRYCRRGFQTVCENLESIGYHYDGGFATFIRIPAKVIRQDGLHRIPDGLSYEAAALAEPLACVLNGQEQVGTGPGDTVVVLGSGPIGCMHVWLARARGVDRIFLIDVDATRLRMAAERVEPDEAICSMEIDPVERVLRLTHGYGSDVIIVAAPSAQAVEQAIAMAARRGRICLFAGLPKEQPMVQCNANQIHYRELTVVGAYGSTPSQNQRALDLIARGEVPVERLITHRLPLDRIMEGLRLMAQGKALKVVITPS
jgi:L-iditol 2-dehydrogenase